MKKMFAMLLVLGLATVASAAVDSYSISGPAQLQLGGTGTYTLEFAGNPLGMFDVSISLSNGLGALGNGKIVAGGKADAWDSVVDYGDGTFELVGGHDATAITSPLATIDITAGNTPGSFDIVLGDVGTFGPGILEQLMPTVQGMTVEVVPEPMTMSLLGLGGLALIRRRK